MAWRPTVQRHQRVRGRDVWHRGMGRGVRGRRHFLLATGERGRGRVRQWRVGYHRTVQVGERYD